MRNCASACIATVHITGTCSAGLRLATSLTKEVKPVYSTGCNQDIKIMIPTKYYSSLCNESSLSLQD